MEMPFVASERNCFEFSRDHVAKVSVRLELPALTLVNYFLKPDECRALIEMSEGRLIESHVIDRDSGAIRESKERSSYDVSFHLRENYLLATIEDRIAAVFNWDQAKSTGIQVIRYLPGQRFSPHFDFINPSTDAVPEVKQRLATILIYLNDVDIGGETNFPDAGLSIAPAAGAALYFSYRRPRRASMTYHSGEPPGPGTVKWLAVKWLTV